MFQNRIHSNLPSFFCSAYSLQKGLFQGFLQFLFTQVLFFCDFKPYAKLGEPYDKKKSNNLSEKKERKRKNSVNSAHLVP
jgi:hypothetical protein